MNIFKMPIEDNRIRFLTQTHWDVIVVGGGMVGALAALGLAKNNFTVLLMEKETPDLNWNEKVPYQTRVSALTRASETILKNVNAWAGIEKRRFHPFTAMHVWEDQTQGKVHFDARDIQEPNLGYVVENNVVQAAIWDELMQEPQITCITGATLTALTLTLKTAYLTIEDLGVLNTTLVVGADGANSKIRELANIELETHEYGQCAIVGCVKTEKSHEDTCWQRYQEEGPFAFLAMNDNVSSIAWYLPLDRMDWALSLNDEDFAAEITRASDERLGQVIEVSKRAAFPLIRRHAKHYVKPHLALIGDAAHTIHPQAGQGVNLGLLDAASLVESLVNARILRPNKDWSRFSTLRRYERSRRGDNALTQRSMEVFDDLFKQNSAFKTEFRKIFLPLANGVTPVKNWVMTQALYGRGTLPKILKNILPE